MKNAKKALKQAINKTTYFMLNLEVNASGRIPEWFEQMALASAHNGLTNSLYERLYLKLKEYLNTEFGPSATKYLLS